MRHFPRLAAAIIVLFVSGLVIAFTASETRGLQYDVTNYGGTHSGDGNVVVGYSSGAAQTSFYAYDIPLNPANCPGQTVTLVMPDVPVTPQYTFDQYDPVSGQGASGEYISNASLHVSGIIYVAQNGPCANQVAYEASPDAVLQGDLNCTWKNTEFGIASGNSGPEPAGAPTTDVFDAIDLVDVMDMLKAAAGLPLPSPASECPAPGTTTPADIVVGDTDCNGQFGPGDALVVVRQLSETPVNVSGANCRKVGQFFLLND